MYINKKFSTLFILLLISIAPLFAQADDVSVRLKGHVDFFTNDRLLGRKAGSDGERKAAEYLYERLEEAGLIMLTPKSGQDFSIAQGDTIKSRNIVGIVEGYDEQLKKEYILIGTHIDHLGTNVLMVNGKEVLQIYQGADASASGLACLIEVAQRIAASSLLFRRSVIVAGFGAQDMGMAGSWYFVNRAFPQIKDVSMMVDLNMVGRFGMNNYFRYFTGVPNAEITSIIGKVARSTSFPAPELGQGQMLSSDYLAFYEKQIPVTLFTTGIHRDYRTIRDRTELLDYESMASICDYVFAFVKEVANLDAKVATTYIVETSSKPEEKLYSPYDVDKTPEFFKGNEKTFLDKWVYDYLKYPEIAVKLGDQGTVIVEFIIEIDGSVSNVKVTKGVSNEIDDEVVRVVSASPKWKAGVLSGKKVRVKYSIPVEFKLKKR